MTFSGPDGDVLDEEVDGRGEASMTTVLRGLTASASGTSDSDDRDEAPSPFWASSSLALIVTPSGPDREVVEMYGFGPSFRYNFALRLPGLFPSGLVESSFAPDRNGSREAVIIGDGTVCFAGAVTDILAGLRRKVRVKSESLSSSELEDDADDAPAPLGWNTGFGAGGAT